MRHRATPSDCTALAIGWGVGVAEANSALLFKKGKGLRDHRRRTERVCWNVLETTAKRGEGVIAVPEKKECVGAR